MSGIGNDTVEQVHVAALILTEDASRYPAMSSGMVRFGIWSSSAYPYKLDL